MATYEKGFVDRIIDGKSCKLIKVTEQRIHSNGTMDLIADIVRYEDKPSSEGTKLDADSMNFTILQLIYDELYDIEISEDLHAITLMGNESKTFYITSNKKYLFPIVSDGEKYIDINFSYNDKKSEYTVTVMPTLRTIDNYDSETELYFSIDFYLDSNYNTFYTGIKGCVTYIPSSSSSTD